MGRDGEHSALFLPDGVCQMKESLAQELWLRSPETRKVAAALQADGARVRFVGGIVRDGLLGKLPGEIAEIDMAINRKPDEVAVLLEAAGLKPHPIGADHGTMMAHLNGINYEITSLRVDVETDGRHAQVAFTQDWLEDAKRRDFTINAIYADMDGTIHDPLDGRADLAVGRVRFIGDAGQRIDEDYLRILRFFRFFAALEQGAADDAALRICGEKKSGLERLSVERIAAELLKLLPLPRGPEALRLMAAAGILPLILPQASRLDLAARLHELAMTAFIRPDPLLLLGALYSAAGAAEGDGERLKFSTAARARLRAMLTPPPIKIVSYLSMREVRRLLYRLGREVFCDHVWLAWAADDNPRNGIGWRALLAMAESWEKPQFPLTGEMVQAAGVAEGPEVGRVMREVEVWWVDADFIDDEFSIIERLKAIVQATIYTKTGT